MNGFIKRFGKGKTLDTANENCRLDKIAEMRCFINRDESLSEDTRKILSSLFFIMNGMHEDLERCKDKYKFLYNFYLWVLIINFFMCLAMASHIVG